MKTIEEVRRARLQQLREEYGTLSALNAKLGLNARDSTLSQILNQAESSSGTKPKSMGSALARKIEEAASKPRGWMDNDPAFDTAPGRPLPFADLNGFEGQLITLFRRLSPDDQHDILIEVNKLADNGADSPSSSNPFPTPPPKPKPASGLAKGRHGTPSGPPPAGRSRSNTK